jgi:hypothetical protein
MSDPNSAIYQAAVHECGHSFAQFLLSGHFGGLEIKATEPGNGACWTRWPDHWADESVKFWCFSGLVDAAGIEAEWLLLKSADARPSRGDLADIETAAHELISLPTEFRSGTPGELVTLFREMAAAILQPHAPALEYLAGKASNRLTWIGGDMETSLVTTFPEYREYLPLFDGDWRKSWIALLDGVNTALERKAERMTSAALRKMETRVRAIGAAIRMGR